ncbi:MAG TPA: universal stress protein [Gemmatimonadales bacterium]|nr:universal stress protein [Gemmatimonadales bacterium]
MQLNHIVAAVDRSEEGRSALGAALTLAGHATGRVTALRVEPPISGTRLGEDVFDPPGPDTPPKTNSRGSAYEWAVRYGLPGVEIGRFAEEKGAGLVVLGRKHRSTTQRLLLGDTADETVRRSQLPCLSVRAGTNQAFTTVLAALDGSARGMAVLLAALDLSRCTGGALRVLTVESLLAGEVASSGVPTTRSCRLAQAVAEMCLERDGDAPLVIRHGQVVDEILAEAASCEASVLVIGYRRGGPAGVIEAGSVARRVLHQAECAVMTVPL